MKWTLENKILKIPHARGKMKTMNVIRQIIGWLSIAAYFTLVLFPIVLISGFFKLNFRLKIVSLPWRGFAWVILKSAWTRPLIIDNRSQEDQSKVPANGLYIADHQSNVDIPLIITRLQLPPIMKKQVLYIPIFGLMGWASGSLVVDRGSKESRKKVFELAANRMLNEGIGLQYYPEGTRSRGKDPKPYSEIKTALMLLAFDKNIPIYPISIYGTHKVLSDKGLLIPFQKIGIIFHAPLSPKNFSSAEQFAQAAWNKVCTGYFELKSKLEN